MNRSKNIAIIFRAITVMFLIFKATTLIAQDAIVVKRTNNFVISGSGIAQQWNTTSWHTIAQTQGDHDNRETKFKTLYSDSGIYFLFSSSDHFITASKNKDFEKLWLEDVVEVFLWPDVRDTIYFEYEISPLNYELPILIPNVNGKFLGWRPWLYEEQRKIQHQTSVVGGKRSNGSKCNAWYAEFFIPFELLAPIRNVPPHSRTRWRANMYRVDYDNQKTIEWSWKKTTTTFHEVSKFGVLIFE